MNKRIFCFIGLPLSGKSFFAKHLASTRRYGYYSTGDIARRLMTTNKLKMETAKRDLFPGEDELRANLWVDINASPREIVIVDGFPRFGGQVKYMISEMWDWFPEVINIDAGDEITLLHRAAARNRDENDQSKAFSKRLALAKANMSDVYSTMVAHSLQWHTIMSGDIKSMELAFDKVLNVK